MSARHSIKFFHPLLLAKERGDAGTGMTKVLSVVSVISVLATIGMVLHLFAATGAEAIADGETNFGFHLQQGIETILDTIWALSIAALAVVGGLTRSVGNRVTLALGLVGGLAFALASATIAFTDRYDPLFAVGSLIGIWGLVVGALALIRSDLVSPVKVSRAPS